MRTRPSIRLLALATGVAAGAMGMAAAPAYASTGTAEKLAADKKPATTKKPATIRH